MTTLSPYDPEIEALWRAVEGSGARSVAVVASLPGEGTTLVASALARRAGLAGTQALLVDLNQVRPGVAKLFSVHPKPGEIVTMPALGLAVLADAAPEDAMAWREPAALAAQAQRWAADYNLVVFDTAPLLSKVHEPIPATAVAAAAEATVLVMLSGRTAVPAIREARSRLATAGARLIGAVMNDRDNPPLLAELERETYRLAPLLPRAMANLRRRLQRATVLSVKI